MGAKGTRMVNGADGAEGVEDGEGAKGADVDYTRKASLQCLELRSASFPLPLLLDASGE